MDLNCEERRSDSPYVELVWRSHSEHAGSFTSMAEIHCGIVVTKLNGRITLTVRGPETRATPAFCPPDAEFMGIVFKAGTFMPDMPAKMVMDRRDVNLPEASSKTFWLNGSAWQFPNFENADTFLEWLVHDGLLVHDPVVTDVLHGRSAALSLRSAQRRFQSATGMAFNTIRQIERARFALSLLKQGTSILDTVVQAGYFDQPHLTRSLKRYIGQTPAQLVDESRSERLSFLYKTTQPDSAMLQMFGFRDQENLHEKNNRIGVSVAGRRHGSAGNMAFPLLE